MGLVPVGDALYLWAESSRCPSHVVALQIFRPPGGAGPELLDELYAGMTHPETVKPAFRRWPYRSAATAGQFAWAQDEDVDLTLHVRRVGLPRQGRIRELLEHVADFHAVRLNRDRPLWEAHLVEGLEDGRFALLTKMHHSQFDGVNMGRHLLGGLSPDPADRDGTAPWVQTRRPRARRRKDAGDRDWLSALGRQVTGVASSVGQSVQALATRGVSAALERDLVLPFTSPSTLLNGRVSSARRFAGDAWPLDRLREVSHRTGTSINDVALTMCAGALRAYLIDRDALPDDSLVAMVPVSLAPTGHGEAAREGNSWAAVLCNLGTDEPDPRARLRRIHASMPRSKTLMSELDPVTATAISASTLGGVALNSLPGLPPPPRPPFNLVISNIPAVPVPVYLNGCELTDAYPVSVVTDGQALNITLVSYADRLAFGITGCRRAVPSLQRLLVHLENALVDLEKETGIPA